MIIYFINMKKLMSLKMIKDMFSSIIFIFTNAMYCNVRCQTTSFISFERKLKEEYTSCTPGKCYTLRFFFFAFREIGTHAEYYKEQKIRRNVLGLIRV